MIALVRVIVHYLVCLAVIITLLPANISAQSLSNEDALSAFAREMAKMKNEKSADFVDGEAPTGSIDTAISNGDLESVKKLIAEGVDPNKSDNGDESPLAMAINLGQDEIALALIRAGANVDKVNHNGESSLCLSAKLPRTNVLREALKYTSNINGNGRCNPLEYLCLNNGSTEMARLLLSQGADPNVSVTREITLDYSLSSFPITAAIANDNYEMVNLLLKNGARADIVSADQLLKKLHFDTNILGVNLTYVTKKIKRVHLQSHKNVHHGEGVEESLIRKYLSDGGDPNVSAFGETLLTASIESNNQELAKTIVIAGADPESRNLKQQTPLMLSVYNGYSSLTKTLIHVGANLDATDGSGRTALHYAYLKGADPNSRESENLLIARGASTEVKDNKKLSVQNMRKIRMRSPTEIMESFNTNGKLDRQKVVSYLYYGGDPNIHAYGETLLTAAVKLDEYYDPNTKYLAQVIIERGADVNKPNIKGKTALMLAAESGKRHYAYHLISSGADLDAVDSVGKTALHYTLLDEFSQTSYKMRELLIENGASQDIADNNGVVVREALVELAKKERERELEREQGILNAINIGTAIVTDVTKAIKTGDTSGLNTIKAVAEADDTGAGEFINNMANIAEEARRIENSPSGSSSAVQQINSFRNGTANTSSPNLGAGGGGCSIASCARQCGCAQQEGCGEVHCVNQCMQSCSGSSGMLSKARGALDNMLDVYGLGTGCGHPDVQANSQCRTANTYYRQYLKAHNAGNPQARKFYDMHKVAAKNYRKLSKQSNAGLDGSGSWKNSDCGELLSRLRSSPRIECSRGSAYDVCHQQLAHRKFAAECVRQCTSALSAMQKSADCSITPSPSRDGPSRAIAE